MQKNFVFCARYESMMVFFFFFSSSFRVFVFEQRAKELGYDQSLMARLCKNLHPSNPQLSPILLLSVQYRMHPDICEFPSKYIYNSALKNDWYAHTSLCLGSLPSRHFVGRERDENALKSDYSPCL